jgi:hypothetical protein
MSHYVRHPTTSVVKHIKTELIKFKLEVKKLRVLKKLQQGVLHNWHNSCDVTLFITYSKFGNKIFIKFLTFTNKTLVLYLNHYLKIKEWHPTT